MLLKLGDWGRDSFRIRFALPAAAVAVAVAVAQKRKKLQGPRSVHSALYTQLQLFRMEKKH